MEATPPRPGRSLAALGADAARPSRDRGRGFHPARRARHAPGAGRRAGPLHGSFRRGRLRDARLNAAGEEDSPRGDQARDRLAERQHAFAADPAPAAAPPLPAFGAIVAEDFPPPARWPCRARPRRPSWPMADPRPRPVRPPRPRRPMPGLRPHAQPAAQPDLHGRRGPARPWPAPAERSTSAALARTELLQIASLPRAARRRPSGGRRSGRPALGVRHAVHDASGTRRRPVRDQPRRRQIRREERPTPLGLTWRARFSLDVEPMGPVHAQVALTGDRAQRVAVGRAPVSIMARLRTRREAPQQRPARGRPGARTGLPHRPAARARPQRPDRFLDRPCGRAT